MSRLSQFLSLSAISAAIFFGGGCDEDVPEPYAIQKADGLEISLNGLIDHEGQVIDDAYAYRHFAGKPLIIYFGFTGSAETGAKACTVFCPPATQTLVDELHGLDIVPVIISSKTGRSPSDMEEWMQNMGVRSDRDGVREIGAIGLTGSDERLQELYAQLPVIESDGNHIPYMLVVDEAGTFLGVVRAIEFDGSRWIPDSDRFRAELRDKLPALFTLHDPAAPDPKNPA